jgi:simple sugar transport system permease protein
MAISLVHGFASITNKGNQIVSGVAINFIAAGLTAVLGQAWFAQGGRTPQLANDARFAAWEWPAVDTIGAIPVVGWVYQFVLSGNNTLTYLAFLAVPISWWVLYRTRFGLRLRAVGENPAAVDTAGISVTWLRYRAVLCAGFLCGFAGAYLSIAQSAAFIKDMSAGKGYIALAALIFAKWKPVPVLFACLLFGYLDSVAIRLQGKSMPVVGEVPVQIFQALPYILTVILLAGFIGVASPPKAGGIPYSKER